MLLLVLLLLLLLGLGLLLLLGHLLLDWLVELAHLIRLSKRIGRKLIRLLSHGCSLVDLLGLLLRLLLDACRVWCTAYFQLLLLDWLLLHHLLLGLLLLRNRDALLLLVVDYLLGLHRLLLLTRISCHLGLLLWLSGHNLLLLLGHLLLRLGHNILQSCRLLLGELLLLRLLGLLLLLLLGHVLDLLLHLLHILLFTLFYAAFSVCSLSLLLLFVLRDALFDVGFEFSAQKDR